MRLMPPWLRVNSLEGLTPNQHARHGYRKNCAAAIGRWQALFAASPTNPSLQLYLQKYVDADQDICVNSDSRESLAELEQQHQPGCPRLNYERLRNPVISCITSDTFFRANMMFLLCETLLPLMAFRDGQSLDYRLPHRGSANGATSFRNLIKAVQTYP